MKKIKNLLFGFILFFGFVLNVDASSMSIWANATNVKVGNSVTVSVKVSDLGGEFRITSSDQTVLAGGTSSKWLENDTYTFTFTAKKIGKATVTVSAIDAATTDAKVFTGSKSVTLNVISSSTGGGTSSGGGSNSGGTTADKKEYSKNNYLSSLKVEGYELEPKFDKNTLEYKIKVDQSVEKINISAKTEDSEASVNGDGEVNLSLGENTIEIKVTAENGNDRKYKLIVLVEDLNPIEVNINKKKYTLVKKNNDLIDVLDNFKEKTIKIDEQEVLSYYNSKTKVSLVILKDEDNKIGYYVYDEKTKKYEVYRYIKVGNINLQLLDIKEKLDNFKKCSIEINKEKVDIYKLKKSSKVGLIYGVNNATGTSDYYVYDEKEDTLARYYDDEISIYKEENKKLENIIMGLIGGFSLTVIIFIVVSLVRSKKRKYRF